MASKIEERQVRIEAIGKKILDCEAEATKQTDISSYLRMTDLEISELNPDDCDEFSYRIMQHALYVQRRLNTYTSLREYCQVQIKRSVSKRIRQYSKGLSWEYAEQCAINECEHCMELQDKILELNDFIGSCNNIIPLLEKMSRKIEGMKYVKRQN